MRHHENDAIMLGIFKTELDVGHQAALQTFQGIAGLLENAIQMMNQARERIVADLIE